MGKAMYRRDPLDIKAELNRRYDNRPVIFIECDKYTESLPKIVVKDDGINVLGSAHIIFNMKRHDDSFLWEYFYDVLGIEIHTSVGK